MPLSQVASIEESDGPNQIGRENSRRRIVMAANSDGSDMAAIIAQICAVLADQKMPEGYIVSLEGQFQAQEAASQLIAGLSLISLSLIFMVLYSRYKSAILAAMIMGNIPMVLIGSVIAIWLAGISLSVASLVGFITLHKALIALQATEVHDVLGTFRRKRGVKGNVLAPFAAADGRGVVCVHDGVPPSSKN